MRCIQHKLSKIFYIWSAIVEHYRKMSKLKLAVATRAQICKPCETPLMKCFNFPWIGKKKSICSTVRSQSESAFISFNFQTSFKNKPARYSQLGETREESGHRSGNIVLSGLLFRNFSIWTFSGYKEITRLLITIATVWIPNTPTVPRDMRAGWTFHFLSKTVCILWNTKPSNVFFSKHQDGIFSFFFFTFLQTL